MRKMRYVVGEEKRKIFYAKNLQKNTFACQYFLIEFGWALIQGLLYLSITKIKQKYTPQNQKICKVVLEKLIKKPDT